MTPKSLMAFVFAIAFAVPAHAADAWCDFDVLSKTYFAHAAERDAFVKDAQPADHLDLYASRADKKLTAKLVRAGDQILLQQGAKLEDAKPAGDVLPGIKTARVLPPAQPPAAQPRRQVAAKSADPDIDAIVAVKGDSFKDPARKELVDALAYIQSNDSALFDRLKAAAADPQKKTALGGLLDVAMGLPQNPDRIAVLRERIPIVLGGAEVAPAGGGSVAGSGPPIQGADTGAADHAGVNKITEALVQDRPTTARPDAVNTIVKFVTDDANKFIADAVRKDEKQMKGLSAGLAEGLGKKFEDPKTATEIGLVYTILLSGDAAQAPAWLAKPESKAGITQVLRAYAKAHVIFLEKMKRWSAGAKDMIGEVKVGPWAGGSGGPGATSGQNTTIDQWMAAFLEDASKQAKAALNASKIDKGLVGRAVEQLGADWNGPANGVPGSGWGGPGSGSGVSLNFTAANFSTKEIYRDGAITQTFSVMLPGASQATPVTIAMKLKFRQYNGTMVPMVDIVDVSNDGASSPGSAPHVYGQAFDLQAVPTSASDLRLQNDPNSYYDKDRYPIQYQLSRSPDDGSITLALDDTHKMTVSPSDLYSRYTDNVMHNAHTVIAGGQQFQVVCQGGSNLQYAFFATKDGKLIDPNNPRPSLLSGAVKSVSVDATTHLPTESQQSSADIPLGNIGLKPDGTQQYYGLHWNQAQGYYDIVQEASEIPDPSAGANNNNNNNNSNTNNNNSTTDNNNNNTNTNTNANNNNTTTTSGPPSGSGTRTSTDSTGAADCKSKDAFSQNASPSDYAGKFRYWTGKDGDTYYCFFGDKFLHAGGYLAKIEATDKDLLLTVVMVSRGATAGITVIDPSKIANGHVDVTIPGKSEATTLDVSGVWVYRFDNAQLRTRKTSNNAAQVSNVAWFQEAYLGTDPTKRDSLRVNFDADAKARAAKAVEIIARYPTDQSGIFGGSQGEGNRKKLKKFLDLQIDKDTGALDADNPPFASISLNLSDPVRQNGGDVVDYTSKTHAGVGLRWITPLSGDPFLEDPK